MPDTQPDPERVWLEQVYKKGARQLTVRAVVTGMLLGGVMCLSNLYVFLKTGWSLGVTLTACILAFGIFRFLRALRIVRAEFSILENNAMSSVASAAGFMTGGGNMSAVPALFLLTGTLPSTGALVVWLSVISFLGVFAAVPIKRQLVNIEQLPFPTGRATAETIESMHAGGKSEKGKWLFGSALIGVLTAWLRDAKVRWLPFHIPHNVSIFPFSIAGRPAADWTLSMEGSLILFAVGGLIDFRTGWSLLMGAVLTYGVAAPKLVAAGLVAEVKYKALVQWTLWPGAALLLSSGLLSFAFQWRSVGKSFSGLMALFRRDSRKDVDPLADVECPAWWFPLGFAILGPVVVYLMWALFNIPWWAGIVSLPLSVFMGVVAARVTGETDVTPTKALGPVTQLIYGIMVPKNVPAIVMGANVTGGVGLHAADLLTDLKSGYMLGANPRQQFIAQLFGVVAGAVVVVPAFRLLIPTPDLIGTPDFPAPSVQVWAGVSRAFAEGLAGLHPVARIATLVGFALGCALTLLDRFAPKTWKRFIPSASGLGIAMVVPGYNAISMFAGSALAELIKRTKPHVAEKTVVPVSSGFIAGESLMGILIAILVAVGWLPK